MAELDSHDTARLFYLGGLILLLAGGLYRLYRGRMGEAARNALIWGLIFFGVVLAYGLRGQFFDALDDDRPVTLSDSRIALERGGDGHFHAIAEINGAPIRFLIDTGASELVLSRRDAETAGVNPDDLVFSVPSRTANGLIQSAWTRLGSVTLGPFSDHGVRALVNGGELRGSLMGMGYLSRFGRVSIEGDRMILER